MAAPFSRRSRVGTAGLSPGRNRFSRYPPRTIVIIWTGTGEGAPDWRWGGRPAQLPRLQSDRIQESRSSVVRKILLPACLRTVSGGQRVSMGGIMRGDVSRIATCIWIWTRDNGRRAMAGSARSRVLSGSARSRQDCRAVRPGDSPHGRSISRGRICSGTPPIPWNAPPSKINRPSTLRTPEGCAPGHVFSLSTGFPCVC